MARETDFDHDQVGHLLADHLIEVPRFQRRYAWTIDNVREYLSDLAEARAKDRDYFVGTVVLTLPEEDSFRRRVVDGQQRLATTSVLLVAIRDRLIELGKVEQAKRVEERYLRGYELQAEGVFERLALGPHDSEAYLGLLNGETSADRDTHPLVASYGVCRQHVAGLAPDADSYSALMDIVNQLEKRVQILVAVATGIQEAYVIFETLNDRGADLTTADLLKNYLFSASGAYLSTVEHKWVQLESAFEKPDDLVRLIRFELISRKGPVRTSKLYRAIQEDIGESGISANTYLSRLVKAKDTYVALRDPDSDYWKSEKVDVRDSLLAYRRFQFESSIPVVLAAFATWDFDDACRLLNKLLMWSVRALFAGNIGAKLAEDTFGSTAAAISAGAAVNQIDVRAELDKLIPSDDQFRAAFSRYGVMPGSRVKYILGMIERVESELAGRDTTALDWSSRGVTIEHIHPKSLPGQLGQGAAATLVDTLGNLTLLEKRLNKGLGSKLPPEKSEVYAESAFTMTRQLSGLNAWNAGAIERRIDRLAGLACQAWPNA
ncbi:DUF262 domain-containing protein [Microbacterium sp. YJN-G]|uniref:DUF262 domain-containing protein n=1 Tax=Microbacterium sp. YJN-G TaxID=2763257 RepID=UPI00187755CE|nr:DUF262 domain-containing protein [Microbacterium sp. YJN-G]